MRLIDADTLPKDEFCGMAMVLQSDIDNAPTIEPKQGEWERIPYSMTDYGRRCSLCHFKVGNPTNFCPNCGARMKGTNK